jgi:hypothetical protein
MRICGNTLFQSHTPVFDHYHVLSTASTQLSWMSRITWRKDLWSQISQELEHGIQWQISMLYRFIYLHEYSCLQFQWFLVTTLQILSFVAIHNTPWKETVVLSRDLTESLGQAMSKALCVGGVTIHAGR